MDKDDKMRMLFLEHHRHLSEIKLKVQGLSQRTITLFAVATGWLVMSKSPPPKELKWVLIIAFVFIGISSFTALRRFNKNYRTESKIIGKLNRYFHFFEVEQCIGNDSIYPESWKAFGSEPVSHGLWQHIIPIFAMMILSIISAWLK